ncbi:MAG: EAL domain-containing protein [Candidatus Dormiibacterota bacterium]
MARQVVEAWFSRAWKHVPASEDLLGRVRWSLLLIALIGLIAAAPLTLLDSHAGPTLKWAGVAGLAWLAWWWIHSYRAGGFNWQGDAACIGVVLLVVVGAGDPANSQMVLLTGVAFRSVSARPAGAYRTAGGFAAAALLGELLTEINGKESISIGDLVALLLALLLLVVIVQIVRGAILRQQQRQDVARAIDRLRPGASSTETARAICNELRNLNGVDFSVVVVFSPSGTATVLAIDAPVSLPLSAGEAFPPARAAYLLERAAGGPWIEPWRQRQEDGDYGRAMAAAQIHGVSYAPIRHQGATLGLLIAGSLHSAKADAVIDNLPVIADFGSAAGALLALDLHAERLLTGRRTLIREIVTSRAFHPVFQAIVDIQSGAVVGYEALTRFTDGEAPDVRFSAAWSVGLGRELELATLERAVRAARELPAGLLLNLNISPRLLDKPSRLRSILDLADRPLVLEITEHEVVTDYRALHDAIRQLGPVQTAVDDAGAGIANFSHIVELNANFVKLDIGLVRGVDADPARKAMIVALCHFARATNCRLIAEGVETEAEATTVRSLGVEFGQGYWYARPSEVGSIVAASRVESRTENLRTRGHRQVRPALQGSGTG